MNYLKETFQVKPMPTLTDMKPGSVSIMRIKHQAYKTVKCTNPFFGESMCLARGYVPGGTTVVRPSLDEDNFSGHSRLVSKFVPTHIDGYSFMPFTKCYGELEHKSGLSTIYEPNVQVSVKPHSSFDTRDASGIHVVDIAVIKDELLRTNKNIE